MACTFTYPSPTPVIELQVRAARFADLPLIQDIHNQGIIDRVATLDTELRTMAEAQLWFKRHGPRHPITVVSRLAEPMRQDCANLSEVIIQSGHWMDQEKPVEVNAAIAKWLATALPDIW